MQLCHIFITPHLTYVGPCGPGKMIQIMACSLNKLNKYAMKCRNKPQKEDMVKEALPYEPAAGAEQ
jgi:hypothetical protein